MSSMMEAGDLSREEVAHLKEVAIEAARRRFAVRGVGFKPTVLNAFYELVDKYKEGLAQSKEEGHLNDDTYRKSVERIIDNAIDAAKRADRHSVDNPSEIVDSLFGLCPGCRPWC